MEKETPARATRSEGSRPGTVFSLRWGRAVPPEPGDDYCDARLKLWRSGDATTWEPVEPSGLAVTDSLDTVAADTSGFLALLARLPGRGRGR